MKLKDLIAVAPTAIIHLKFDNQTNGWLKQCRASEIEEASYKNKKVVCIYTNENIDGNPILEVDISPNS